MLILRDRFKTRLSIEKTTEDISFSTKHTTKPRKHMIQAGGSNANSFINNRSFGMDVSKPEDCIKTNDALEYNLIRGLWQCAFDL